jgi:dipeptidyl aminopeptidase/acylaminoacyl peptidase
MPDRAHPPAHGVPAVVLVHGSGAMDRDETIGPNRPFLDIARGLAAQGIAVLRYEKRSKARPQDFASGAFTIDDETTDDAVAAVAALRATKGIDPARVFVFGHSQGAMMAPRIAAHSGHVAGLVLLAAPARPLLDILVEQNVRLAVLDDGSTSPQEAAAIATLKQQVAAVRAGGDVALQQSPLHQPATYWRSTDAVHPVDEARAVARPMLLLQGARDIQVVDADWQAWKQGLHADRDVAFRLYPTLNHLGIAVGDNEGLAGYSHPGHVDAALIKDVAEWIRAH